MEHLFFNPAPSKLAAVCENIKQLKVLDGSSAPIDDSELQITWQTWEWLGYQHQPAPEAGAEGEGGGKDYQPSFSTYARLRGWNFEVIFRAGLTDEACLDFRDASLDQMAKSRALLAMLQSWFIIGFLESCLCRRIMPSFLTRSDEAAKMWLDTRNLTYILIARLNHLRSLGDDYRRAALAKVGAVVAEYRRPVAAMTRLLLNDHPDAWARQFGEGFLVTVRSIMTCSALLGEITNHVLARAVPGGSPVADRMFLFGTQPHIREPVLTQLQSYGLCRWLLEKTHYASVTEILWLLHWASNRKSRRTEDHSACDKLSCKFDKLTDYEPKHFTSCQLMGCRLTSLDQDLLSTSVARDLLPLVEVLITESGQIGSINLKSYNFDEYPRYAAFSHVWRQGLGNNAEGQIYSCQLEQLCKILYDTTKPARSEGSVHDRSMHFWVDSLCLPISESLRRTAIAKMNTIYSNAAMVIALDADALSTNLFTASGEERVALVAMSSYTSRLWTFLEAFSAKILVFAGQRSYYVMREGLALHPNDDRPSVPPAMELVKTTLDLRFPRLICKTFQQRKLVHTDATRADYDLRTVMKEASGRVASKAKDEMVVLALILGLDTTKLLDTDGDARIVAFYDTLGTVPWDWIFLPVPRLTVLHYEWAPTSFCKREADYGAVSTVTDQTPKSRVTPAGLIGEYMVMILDQELALKAEDKPFLIALPNDDGRSFAIEPASNEQRITSFKIWQDGKVNLLILRKSATELTASEDATLMYSTFASAAALAYSADAPHALDTWLAKADVPNTTLDCKIVSAVGAIRATPAYFKESAPLAEQRCCGTIIPSMRLRIH